MNTDHDTNVAIGKLLIAWIGALLGSISLSNVVLFATLVFTLLNIYKLVRELWFKKDKP